MEQNWLTICVESHDRGIAALSTFGHLSIDRIGYVSRLMLHWITHNEAVRKENNKSRIKWWRRAGINQVEACVCVRGFVTARNKLNSKSWSGGPPHVVDCVYLFCLSAFTAHRERLRTVVSVSIARYLPFFPSNCRHRGPCSRQLFSNFHYNSIWLL